METKYEVYVTGECFGSSDAFFSKTDKHAKSIARSYLNPHQSNWTWYGSVILTNTATRDAWILMAGSESEGWQVYEG